MHTLLLRLEGPMQSWGTQSRYNTRDTGQEPSKSGVVGLLCAALGRPREATVDDLAALRLGVRVDRAGIVEKDYHTVSNIALMDRGTKDTELTTRFYLADASFLIGLEGDDPRWLETIEEAVREPVWQLSLGRKSFVPSEPIALPWRNGAAGGMRRDADLDAALRAEPWLDRRGHAQPFPTEGLRLVTETPADARSERRMDQPAPGVSIGVRRFFPRYVRTDFIYGESPEKGDQDAD